MKFEELSQYQQAQVINWFLIEQQELEDAEKEAEREAKRRAKTPNKNGHSHSKRGRVPRGRARRN